MEIGEVFRLDQVFLYAAYIACGLYIAVFGMRFNVQHPDFVVALVSDKASLVVCYIMVFFIAQWNIGLGMLVAVIIFLTYFDVKNVTSKQ